MSPTEPICPFCQKPGRLTKEHVWAQWLRGRGVAYPRLADQFHGQRHSGSGVRAVIGADGVLRHEMVEGGRVSDFLATVTLKVCARCNGGWMNELEIGAREAIDPVFASQTVTLATDVQLLLARWAIKSLFAYSRATRSLEIDPFPRSELKRLAKHGSISPRWTLWIGYSPRSSVAHMAMGVDSYATSWSHSDLSIPPQNNMANCFVAAHGVVILAHWLPPDSPEMLYDAVFPEPARAGLVKLWPPSGETLNKWPHEAIEPERWERQRRLLGFAISEIGLPEAGLTVDDRRRVLSKWLAGADAADLRQEWSTR